MTSLAPKQNHSRVTGAVSRVNVGFAIITIAGVIIGLPCLVYGFPFYGDDSIFHALSYSRFSEQLSQGEIYPRWLGRMNGELGSPSFFYYPPLPYYLTSACRVLSTSHQFGLRQLGVGAVAALVASGLTLHLWLRGRAGRWPSVAAAIVYMMLPYHLNIDLYTRGAYAELWSFVWLPLVLYAIDRIGDGRRFGVSILAVSYACLVTTHLPTTLIFSPVLLAYAQVPATKRLTRVGLTVAGMLLGVGLSAVYLIPALALQRFSFLSEGTTGHFFYGHWFLFTGLIWSGSRSDLFWFSLEVAALGTLAFAVLLYQRRRELQWDARFWFLVSVFCIFMMSPLSRPVWAFLPPLQKVQFPWRFNTVLSLAVAALLAIAFAAAERWSPPALVLKVAVIVLLGIWSYDAIPRAWFSYPVHYVDHQVVMERNKWLEQSRDQDEYRPRWVVSIKEPDLAALLQKLGKTPDLPGTVSLSIQGRVAIESWKPSEIELSVAASEAAVVTISQFYFPGWEGRVLGGEALEVTPSIPGGLVSARVPAGSSRVIIKRVRTSPEIVGLIVSAITLALMLGMIARTVLPRRVSKARATATSR